MRVLYIDIETAPNVADVWDLWNQNVSLNQLRESSYMLCWAAKWKGDSDIFFESFWGDPLRMLTQAHLLLDMADVLVTYNGDRFDIPTLNKEFLLGGFKPPSPYKSLDIYRTVKTQFKFPSGKLDYVGQALGVGRKVEHEGHDLWVKVREGDWDAQRRMEEYNKGDVILLEEVHDALGPWLKSSPNFTLFVGSECPRCDDGDLERRGFVYTALGQYQRYRCRNCGGWSRDTTRLDGVKIQGA